jgi:hypothetical protein
MAVVFTKPHGYSAILVGYGRCSVPSLRLLMSQMLKTRAVATVSHTHDGARSLPASGETA